MPEMRSALLLPINGIRDFFAQHQLPLAGTVRFSSTNLKAIHLAALKLNLMFGIFLASTILDADNNQSSTNFENFEEVEEAFIIFGAPYFIQSE